MKTKIWLIIGTMAIAITINGSKWTERNASEAEAAALAAPGLPGITLAAGENGSEAGSGEAADPFMEALGVSSDEELYYALYDGKTLAEVAADNGRDAGGIVSLQVAELTAQLNQRLESGSISPEVYQAQKAELTDIITRSVYGTA